MRVRRALDLLTDRVGGLSVVLGFGAGGLLLAGQEQLAQGVLLFALVGLGVETLWRVREQVSPGRGALVLDAHHGAKGRIVGALDCVEHPPVGASSFIDWAFVEAEPFARIADARAAVPLRRQPRFWCDLFALTLALFLGALRVEGTSGGPTSEERLLEPKLGVRPFLEVEETRARLSEELGTEGSEALTAAREELLALLDRVRDAELEERMFLLELSELENSLQSERARAEQVLQVLEDKGRALEGASLARTSGQALVGRRLADAAEALDALARRLADAVQPLGKGELEALRRALEEASGRREARSEKGKEDAVPSSGSSGAGEKAGGAPPDVPSSDTGTAEAQERRRRLERLERRAKRNQATERELDELDEKLVAAAQELFEERQKAAPFVEQASQAVRRLESSQLSQAEKQKLLEQIQDLKRKVREQREQGSEGQKALERFRQRARGEASGEQSGKGSEDRAEQPGTSSGEQPGGAPRAFELSLSQRVEGPGAAPDGAGSLERQDAGPGQEPGTQHDSELFGGPTEGPTSSLEDHSAVAQDSGSGPSESEVVERAARQGFRSVSYEKLFRTYQPALEEALRRDAVPSGYKGQVKRYFELIRPTTKNPPSSN